MSFGVVIVNYNSARLALDAALSVLGDDPTAKVVIVDNCSTDDSINYFKAVCAGADRPVYETPRSNHHPIAFAEFDSVSIAFSHKAALASITILPQERNGGFAAGCNAGLAFLQHQIDPSHFLLLNPDAIIGDGSMAAFEARLHDPSVGLCGATVLRFEACDTVQALGGARFNRWALVGKNICAGALPDMLPETSDVESRLDYPLGAAIGLRADFLESVGGLDERFFLYYEEADWARRGSANFRVGWARGAIVYHRHGAAAGSRLKSGGRSALADFHMARSRILYSLKWSPVLALAHATFAFGQAIIRIIRRRPANARAVIGGAFSPIFRFANHER